MRKLCLFAVGFAAAAAGYVYLAQDGLMLALAGAALLCSILLHGRRPRRVSVFLLGLAMGITWCFLYQQWLLAPVQQIVGSEETRTVVLTEAPFATDYGAAAEVQLTLEGRTFSARLYGDESLLDQSPGDRVTGVMEAERASRFFQNSGTFLVLSASGDLSAVSGAPSLPMKLRLWLQGRIDALFSGQAAALLRALITGDRYELSYETENALSVTGLSHAVAVSGMHVAILVSLLHFLTLGSPQLTAVLGMPLVVLFTLLTGATPSACRAAVMQLILLSGRLVHREYDMPTALGGAGLLLLAQNPWVIGSVSFQLSFAAVAGIYLFAGRLTQRLSARLPRFLAASIASTLSATALTVPLSLLYFHTLSLIAPLTNLLCLWAITGAFCCGLLACTVLPPLAIPAGWLLQYVLRATSLLARWPYAAAYLSTPAMLIWGMTALCVAIGTLFLSWRRGRLLFAALAVGFFIAAVCGRLPFWSKDAALKVLDVGQGQCLLFESGGFTALFDCGGADPEDAGEQAARTLHGAGLTNVDALVLTHYDLDHAGGAMQLLSRVAVDFVYLPDLPEEDGLRDAVEAAAQAAGATLVCVTGETTVTFSGGQLRLFPPVGDGTSNDGLAILASAGEYDMLVTGDLDFAQEQQLLARYDIPPVELLVAGHHGAADSTSLALLNAVKPQVVVISVGADNSYGHPAEETLARITSCGAALYRTDLSGSIIFRR